MLRRHFLRAAGAAALPSLAQGRKKPNIIVIMADDLGFSDIGCYGSEIATPNLDRLAKNGVRFTQFYNTARCCPTRAALLTGLYNHQAGIGHMVNDRGFPSYRGFLNENCVTIAEAIRGSGYTPLMVGKWHVGEQRPHWPTDRGFERYFGLISGASNYWKLDGQRKMALDDKPYVPDSPKFYMTDAFTDHAVKFIDEYGRKNNPYFLYLAYTAPHWPLHAWPEDIAKYRGKYKKGWDRLRQERHERQMAMGIVNRKWPLTARDEKVPAWESVENKDEWDLRMAVYAAQIDRMDQGIGRVLDKVKELGQEQDTLILFLADNGGCAEGPIGGEQPGPPGPAESFTSYLPPWANASNTPFRLYKHWVHEGGISSPLIMQWPNGIRQKNAVIDRPSHLIDIMATCMEVSGGRYPSTHKGKPIVPAEGQSLMAAVRGEKQRKTTLFWEHEGNRAVRDGDWKAVSRFKAGWELYNMAADRTETRDLASKESARLDRMTKAYDAWAAKCGVLPFDKVRGRSD
ncbi:MAG: arylsulfatase [Candidatus Solibacter usitatus]|nr:arylsulfatase [Candidatus Solibacter usitatus]